MSTSNKERAQIVAATHALRDAKRKADGVEHDFHKSEAQLSDREFTTVPLADFGNGSHQTKEAVELLKAAYPELHSVNLLL